MATLVSDKLISTDYQAVFDRQRRHAPIMARTTTSERIARLKRLQTWIADHDALIKQALYDDFRKPASEAVLTELYGLNGELNFAIRYLNQWMKPWRVPTPVSLTGMRSYVRYEPKGNVLVIAPWNYPFLLCIKPMLSAIAAGNVVIAKPSEMTPHTTRVIQQLVADVFPPEEVAVFAGDASVSTALLALPFDHIFFTGSPAVGKLVMAAAAKHLTSVTLELGGKSPCIIDETADVEQAAGQIAWGKGVNSGQTCIAPDYVLIHESVKPQFVRAFGEALQRMYNADGRGVRASDSYCRLVNRRHFDRVRGLMEEAVEQGATVSVGGQMAETENFIEPTLIEGVTDGMRIMQDEIFGPVLPLQTYTDKEDVIRRI
ncbi:MAG: aldehyde dehydrogenase family protein, partial [Bacteroidetes bacterium]|nr:aldehyde dehydrogenase family protein [Fibrella sp.]